MVTGRFRLFALGNPSTSYFGPTELHLESPTANVLVPGIRTRFRYWWDEPQPTVPCG
jgi:hypothetical protein